MMPINHFETGVAETGAEVQAHWNLIVDAANDATDHIDTDGNPHDSQLAELSDVDDTDKADGRVPVWRDAEGAHVYEDQAGGLPAGVQGDVLYHNGSDWVALNAGTSGQVLTTQGEAANPTWDDVPNELPAGVQGDVLYHNGSGWVVLTAGTAGQVLTTQGEAANPTWDDAASGLPEGVQGDILYHNGSGWVVLNAGTSGQVLKTQGASANPIWDDESGGSLPEGVQGDILYHNGSGWVVLNAGTSGQFLKTQGASANPLWDDAPASAPHADTHQDGGDDEVATTTPSSGAIPKAGTDSKLPAGFIDTLTAEGPSQTLVDSAEEDRWTKVERAAGETTHTAQVTNSVGAPTEKPDPPVLDTEYTVDGAGQPLATNIHLDAVMTEGSGATLDDISGNGRDGTIVGPVWDTDANPLYTPFLDADGINDYVTFGDCGGFGRTQAWTTHFKIKTAPGYSFGGVIVGRCNASYYVGWYQGLDNNGKVYMVMQNGGNYIQVHGSTSVNDGNWHDVTVRHSGSGVASGISMWVDGVAESMTIDSDTLGSNSINNSDALRMFAMVNGQYGDYIATHLAIWQRALEAVEAVDLHDMPYVMEGGVIGQVTSDIAYVTVAPATEDGDTADVTVGQTASRVSVPGKLVVVNGRLRCAADTKYGPPVSGTYAVGDLFFDRAGSLWQCSVAGAPGTWVQVEPGRQTTAQWTDFATGGNWNGGAALADYRCYEPDFDETWTYDATHGWLGRYWEAISEHTSDVTGSSQYRLGILPRVHNLLMTHAMAYTGVSSCDANNYWTVRLCKAYLSGGSFSYTACTDDVVRDSTGNLETTWTPDGVVIDTDVYGWYARQYAKTGSPGTLTFGHVGVTFRYVRK